MTDKSIERRDMLQALGGTATLVGLAGCLGGGGGGDGGDGSSGDGGDGSSGDGGDGGSGDGGSSDGGDGGSDDGSEDGGGEDGSEEEPEEVPVLAGTVYESDGETKVSEGQLTFIDNLGSQVATHDLAVSAEFRVTDLEINGEYELKLTQMSSYPNRTVEFVAEPPEGYGEEEDGEDGGGGGNGEEEEEEEEEDPEVPLTVAVDEPEASIVDPETNSITMETGVTGTESYAWEGELEFQTSELAGQWTHAGERAASKNAVVNDENLAQTKARDKGQLRRVFVFEENEEGERVLRITLVDPIQTGTTCREEDDVGGYPDWVAHQAVQHGLAPFDSFTYNGKKTFDEHPAKLGGIRVKEYEVDPEGTPLTFTLFADNETGDVVRIDGDFATSEIDKRIFESQLLSTRGVIDFFGHGENRFIGVNAC